MPILGIDPGLKTGISLVGEDGKIILSTVFNRTELQLGLPAYISVASKAYSKPLIGCAERTSIFTGKLGNSLLETMEYITGCFSQVGLKLEWINPSDWKPKGEFLASKYSAGKTLRDLGTIHQKDAFRIALYFLYLQIKAKSW